MTRTRIVEGAFLVDALPEKSLILLVGTSGSGKSTLARHLFGRSQVVSSDRIRGWIADDEGDQSVSGQAFEILSLLVRMRLEHGRTTVVDATNVSRAARRDLVRLARRTERPAVAVVLDVDFETCVTRDSRRRERRVGRDVIESQRAKLNASLAKLADEGFVEVRILNSADIAAMLATPRSSR